MSRIDEIDARWPAVRRLQGEPRTAIIATETGDWAVVDDTAAALACPVPSLTLAEVEVMRGLVLPHESRRALHEIKRAMPGCTVTAARRMR